MNSILVEKWKVKSIPTCDSKTETGMDGVLDLWEEENLHIPLYP